MVETGLTLDVLRLAIGTIILAVASYTDIKTRRASNVLWVILGIGGGIMLFIQFLLGEIENLLYLIFIPVMIGFVYLLFQFRLIFGGADAKALMALTILVPLDPLIIDFPVWDSPMPFPWVIFSNSIILFILIPIGLMVFNIIRKDIKFPYFFLGYRMDVDKAKKVFVWPLEKIVDGQRKFSYMPRDFDAEKDFEVFEKNNISEIWVTPKIPFMIPLLAGFICSFTLGDILFYLVNLVP